MRASARVGALIAAGSVIVHEGRHLLCGHPRLGTFGPLVAIALALLVGTWMQKRAATWPRTTVALLAVFAAQEALEIASGAPVDPGAWTAVPLALAIGGLIALVLRGARAVERSIRPWSPVAFVATEPPAFAVPAPASIRPPAPLARLLAGRAPPLAS